MQFTVIRAGGKVVDVQTNSPELTHFLRLLKLSRAHTTWLTYALDLRRFFGIVQVPPQQVGRPECLIHRAARPSGTGRFHQQPPPRRRLVTL
jgi:hypothetical protein